MSTRVRLPDGSYVTVPTDDTKQAAAAARAYWSKRGTSRAPKFTQAQKDAVRDMVGPGSTGVMVDSFLPGWADEIYAAPGAALAWIKGEDAGEAFRTGQRQFRESVDGYKKRNPIKAALASGTGMAGGLVLPAGRALKGASLGRKVLQGAKVGALYGAVTGAGEGEGLDLSRRGKNAMVGGALGATVGSSLPVLSSGALAGGRLAREFVPGVDAAVRQGGKVLSKVTNAALRRRSPPPGVLAQRTAPERRAERQAVARMSEGRLDMGPGQFGRDATPQAVIGELERRQGMGVPAVLGDVTQPLRDLTASAASHVGPGQRLVRERLEARKAAEGERVQRYIRDHLPTVGDPVQFVESTRRAAKDAVAPLYREAYGQPVYRTPSIQAIEETPAFRDALPQAYRNIRNQIDEATGRPKDPEAMGFRYFDADPGSLPSGSPYFPLPDRGYVSWDNGLSTEGYDQVVRAMSDNATKLANRNPLTGRVEHTTDSVHVNTLARDLREALADQNGAYSDAVRRYGDDTATVDAFTKGGGFGSLTGAEMLSSAEN